MSDTQPLAEGEYLFTSESVTEGHPDKVCDQISDAVLDAVMAGDPEGRVACETMVNTGMAVVSGEISTDVHLDVPDLVRETIRKIGYDHGDYGYHCDHVSVLVSLDKQSPDIAQGVDKAYETRTDASVARVSWDSAPSPPMLTTDSASGALYFCARQRSQSQLVRRQLVSDRTRP